MDCLLAATRLFTNTWLTQSGSDSGQSPQQPDQRTVCIFITAADLWPRRLFHYKTKTDKYHLTVQQVYLIELELSWSSIYWLLEELQLKLHPGLLLVFCGIKRTQQWCLRSLNVTVCICLCSVSITSPVLCWSSTLKTTVWFLSIWVKRYEVDLHNQDTFNNSHKEVFQLFAVQ